MSNKQNAAKPKGFGGKRTLNRMNGGVHAEMSEWGLSFLTLEDYKDILEIGCGGGANIARLLAASPDGHVTGVDYSEVSVKASRKENADAIRAGRCTVEQENVREMSFADESFDLAAAFETIYFWPDIAESFAQVFRVLKNGGTFFICNETDGDAEEGYRWAEEIEGMEIYKESDIVDLLGRAGFEDIAVERDPERHWICFRSRKTV